MSLSPFTPRAPRQLLDMARAMGRCGHCGREPFVGTTDGGWCVLRSHAPECPRTTPNNEGK